MGNISIMFLLCAPLISCRLALPIAISSTTPLIKTEPPRDNTRNTTATTEQTNNISNSTPSSSDTSASTADYSSVIPKNSINTTTSHPPEHNSTAASLTKHIPTGITRVQTTASSTFRTLATQSASEPTSSVSTASTFRSSVATVNGSHENTSNIAVYFTNKTTLWNKNNETTGAGLSHSEMSLTILFSVVLGVIVLIVLGQFVFKVTRSKHRSIQYTHQPLYNEDTGARFVAPDDMLVISGGLYDGPQIYNSTVTALNEDQPTFAETPLQFRLEFLQDQGREHNLEPLTFKTFNSAEP